MPSPPAIQGSLRALASSDENLLPSPFSLALLICGLITLVAFLRPSCHASCQGWKSFLAGAAAPSEGRVTVANSQRSALQSPIVGSARRQLPHVTQTPKLDTITLLLSVVSQQASY